MGRQRIALHPPSRVKGGKSQQPLRDQITKMVLNEK
jgi:hypothetical protein